MALAATTVWEVQSGGNDANGGGFNSAASGTDYTQQAAAQVAYTDLVIDAAVNTNLTSAATPFTALHVGNIINVTGGTGFTVQRVQIVSVAAGVATCDKSCGTLGSTGGTGNLGGALALPATAITNAIASNTIWVKSATYAVAANQVLAAGVNAAPTRLIGYGTVRGDTGQPTFTTATGNMFNQTNGNVVLKNFIGDLTGGAARLIQGTGNHVYIERVKAVGGTSAPAVFDPGGSGWRLFDCWAQGCRTGFASGTFSQLLFCRATGSTTANSVGFSISGPGVLVGCIAANMSGATSDGFSLTTTATAIGCVAYKCSRDGFVQGTTGFPTWLNCISVQNGRYGFNATNVWTAAYGNYNATYLNTTAARNNVVAGANDVTLTGSPFTDGDNNNFSLNNTAGAGAACKAVGFPGTLQDGVNIGYAHIGALVPQAAAGGGGLLLPGGWNGGYDG